MFYQVCAAADKLQRAECIIELGVILSLQRWDGRESGVMSLMLPYYAGPHACVCDPSQPRGGERSPSLSPWPSQREHWSSAKQ